MASAREKISEELIRWSFTEQALFLLSLKIDLKATEDQNKTLAWDTRSSRIILEYNENFVNAIPVSILRTELAIEFARLLLQHPTLRVKSNRQLSLMASNLTLEESFLPKVKAYAERANQEILTAEKLGISHQNTFEEWYEKLFEIWVKVQLFMPEDQISKHHNPKMNSNAENWGPNELVRMTVADFVRSNEAGIRDCSLFGDGVADAIINVNGKNELQPKDILRRFIRSVETDKYTESRKKYNRRYGLDAPGKIKTLECNCLVGVDTSGSISSDELKKFFTEINALCKEAQVDCISWDTKVYENTLEKNKKFSGNSSFKVNAGHGGTAPECFFDYAAEHKYNSVVCITDGVFNEFELPKKRMKICWVVIGNGMCEDFLQKTGTVVRFKSGLPVHS
ncbi:MAG: VWA-like domain-containing protein [Fibromonadales bacterium]|nr:VWA-like domain-containing protein [Fibromonadales bacterium]